MEPRVRTRGAVQRRGAAAQRLARVVARYVYFDSRMGNWHDTCVLFTARCVGIFGPFDPRLLRRGRYAANYFTKSGLVYERDETSEELRLMRPKKTTLARRLGLDPEVSLFLVIIRVIRLTSCFVYRWTRRSAGATGSSGFYWGCWR